MVRDNIFFGLIMGLLIPLLGMLFFFVIKYVPQNVSLVDFYYLMKSNKTNISKVISLGLIACIPLITFYKNRRCYKTLQGVFVAIIVYGIFAVAFKYHFL